MYRFMTPGIDQLARRQMDAIGGHEVVPVEICVTAPFLTELLEHFQVDTPGVPHCPDYRQARHTADHSKLEHIRAQW